MTNLQGKENMISWEKERREKVIMENFKAMFFKFANLQSPEHKSVVEKFLRSEILPNLSSTPDHLPYPVIIEGVLKKLKEPCSKEKISKLMKEEYPNLPWAHETFLQHYLDLLRENKTIIQTSNDHFILRKLH